jgi:hypothetical protein
MMRIFAVLLLGTLFFSTARATELPSRDPGVVVPLLVHGPRNLAGIERILGRPDSSFISGFRIYVFHLEDATSVYVASPDQRRVFGIRRSVLGAEAVTLYEPLGDDLMRPAPTSAPF